MVYFNLFRMKYILTRIVSSSRASARMICVTYIYSNNYEAAASGSRPFILSTDASLEGFGAVLSQADALGKLALRSQ